MKFGKFQELVYQFLFTVVVFALLSEIFTGNPQLVRNACWAVGFTILRAICDELKPATQRIVNMVAFGAAVVLMPIAISCTTNTTSDYVAEVLVLVYSLYRFCEALTGEDDGNP